MQRFFRRMGVLLGLARTDHDRRALLRQHEDRDTPLWLLSPTHTTNGPSPPNNHTYLSLSARSSRRRVHVAGGLSGRPCVVYGGLPHTRTHSSRRRAGYAASARPVPVTVPDCKNTQFSESLRSLAQKMKEKVGFLCFFLVSKKKHLNIRGPKPALFV